MKMIQIGGVSIAILSLVINSMSFVGDLESFSTQKASLDFSQAVLSAPCLVERVNGDGRKGLIGLDKLKDLEKLCVDIGGDYEVVFKTYAGNFEFTKGVIGAGEPVIVPFVIDDRGVRHAGTIEVRANIL